MSPGILAQTAPGGSTRIAKEFLTRRGLRR